jgi:hypothetical protein
MHLLDSLLDGRRLWRANAAPPRQAKAPLPTGDPALDALLPDRGWPRADLGECLTDERGVGELRLLMPAIATLSHEEARWVAWINPPHVPYAPALARHGVRLERVLLVRPPDARDTAWVIEQALRSGTCSIVVAWPDPRMRHAELRRLQLAAVEGGTFGLLFRPAAAARQASPAPLRLQVRNGTDAGCIDVRVLKRRGGWAGQQVTVRLPSTPAPTLPADLDARFALWRHRRSAHTAHRDTAGRDHAACSSHGFTGLPARVAAGGQCGTRPPASLHSLALARDAPSPVA